MTVEPLPFEHVGASLQENLRVRHIPDVTRWLLGTGDSPILALECNSNWEAALSVEFLLWARQLHLEHGEQNELCEKVSSRIVEIANRLIYNATDIPDSGSGPMCCWDSVTWDTSVVVRALLSMIKHFPDEFAKAKRSGIEQRIVQAVQWLIYRFDMWETEVKFPFGPCDVAQILITLVYIRSEHPSILKKCLGTGYMKTRGGTKSIEAEILSYLLKEATSDSMAESNDAANLSEKNETLYSWGNFFNTAEVLEALAITSAAATKADPSDPAPLSGLLVGIISEDERQLARSAAVAAFRYLEAHQINGEWGTHVDTTRCLYAYVKSTYLLGERPEPHIVFRALRWACDGKQVFCDGSFLHTMFLTVFYALALRETYDHWEPARKSLQELYDDVVWASPARTTAERGKRLRAEIELDGRNKEIDRLVGKLGWTKAWMWTMLVLLAGTASTLLIGCMTGVLGVKVWVPHQAPSPATPFIALMLAGVSAIVAIVWKARR